LTYIQFVADLAKSFDARADELVAELLAVRDQVIRESTHVVALVGDDAELDALRRELPRFSGGLAPEPAPAQAWSWAPVERSEALLSASKVQYVAQGANYRALGFSYSGRLELLRNILSRDFLMQKVRLENGAYGVWASFTRSGLGYFSSYRDPQLEKTIDVYGQAADFVNGFDADERAMTRFIIGTIAKRDKPYPPRVEGMDAIDNFLTGLTNEIRQKERQEILGAKPADIQALAPVIEKMIANANLCVYGNEELLKEKKSLFGSLVPVIE
jgi:Zn-dependent M16 (insulinase) family peptidase